MRNRIYSIVFSVILSVVCLSGCSHSLELTVLHVNDVHSHLDSDSMSLYFDGVKTKVDAGGFSRLATKIDTTRLENDNTILLAAGDAVQGTLYFTRFHGEPEVEWLNWVSCDAMVTGNHEFDRGSETLAAMIERAEFPVLAANLDTSADPLLSGKIKPYTVLEVDGRDIGIIGLVTPDTPEVSNPDPELVFLDPLEAATIVVDQLTEAGINIIFILSHCGYEKDINLAKSLRGVDVIVGGHTHTVLGTPDDVIAFSEGDYPTIVTDAENNPVYIVHAGSHGLQLGQLMLQFDGKGVVTDARGSAPFLVGNNFAQKDADTGKYEPVSPELLSEYKSTTRHSPRLEIVTQDPLIQEKLNAYGAEISELKKQVIGSIDIDLEHTRVPTLLLPEQSDFLPYGSELAPIVADAMFTKAQELGLHPDLALQNAGGVRRTIFSGDVTVGTVYEVLPFENTLFVMDMTGGQIIECLESVIERIREPDNDGAFPYTSRLRYTLDMWQKQGERLSHIAVLNDQNEWTPIDQDAVYRIATNAYLSSGRDGYSVMGKSKGYRYDTGFIDAEIFMEYIQNHGPLKVEDPLISIVPVKAGHN